MIDDAITAALSDVEVFEMGKLFARVADTSGTPQAASWARFEGWRLTHELAQRLHADPGLPPEIVLLRDLGSTEIDTIRDLFERLAKLANDDGQPHIARWFDAVREQSADVLETRRKPPSADVRRIFRENTRERRPGTPGDISHNPPWSQVSGPPDFE